MKAGKDLFSIIWLSLAFTVALIACRVIYTGRLHYIFLLWNLFLAWVPFILSRVLVRQNKAPGWVQFAVLLCWLIFFPNSPYIITDFLHLGESPAVPQWYDVLLLFSASWNGLLLGILSLYYVEKFIEAKFNATIAAYCIVIFLFLCGFGVYAGRYLRWNSWEVITRPDDIAKETITRILHPHHHTGTWAVTFLLGTFLSLIYFTIKRLKQLFVNP
jgi:uncharacterized membrane protein